MRIDTPRLLLRPLEAADLDELHALHSDAEVAQYIRPMDRPGVEARLRLASEEWAERGYGLMAVVERESGRFVGRAGLRYWPQFDEAELGWALHQDVWGLGYATEAGRACMEWGLGELGLPYVTAMIQPVNLRSIKVAQRLGLEPLREDVLLGDDVIVYARSRASWPDGG